MSWLTVTACRALLKDVGQHSIRIIIYWPECADLVEIVNGLNALKLR